MLIREYLEDARTEDLVRLCKFLGIHPSTDWKRSSMINWLVYEGVCGENKFFPKGWD